MKQKCRGLMIIVLKVYYIEKNYSEKNTVLIDKESTLRLRVMSGQGILV